jgi:hypothetical protein
MIDSNVGFSFPALSRLHGGNLYATGVKITFETKAAWIPKRKTE